MFSFKRFFAILLKEFIQMRRDRLTFIIMIGIPFFELIIFGYAINTDPKHLPTAVLSYDQSSYTRRIIAALKTSDYFAFMRELHSEEESNNALSDASVQFVLEIPTDFSRKILRGERPALLLRADASDPIATGTAISAITNLSQGVLIDDLKGVASELNFKPGPINVILHRNFNPEGITSYNIVPGLMGVVLTMTMVMITALAITKERERGTMENILSTPARPIEVMFGKIIPYILVGYIQMTLIVVTARFLFRVPIQGSVLLLFASAFVFIIANLAMGITFSTVAKNQLQAVQMSFFFFLPSILLSGFMFPFRGMPYWAQMIGQVLPLTHFLLVVRGILLKGNGIIEVAKNLYPVAVFAIVVLSIGVARYRRTLD